MQGKNPVSAVGKHEAVTSRCDSSMPTGCGAWPLLSEIFRLPISRRVMCTTAGIGETCMMSAENLEFVQKYGVNNAQRILKNKEETSICMFLLLIYKEIY